VERWSIYLAALSLQQHERRINSSYLAKIARKLDLRRITPETCDAPLQTLDSFPNTESP
jgi:uncharacterized membrane protein YebE (DUF533 family)